MHNNLDILFILTIGLTLACIFAYIVQKCKMSPILGYLIAGYLIGPFSPGFVANLSLAEQLAEIGVVLMLFGVGLHFKLEDLIRVKNVAIPGALFQTLAAVICTTLFVVYMGWSVMSGVITGLSVGVASTVILVRVLTDNHLLNTRKGHIAIGWLVVEDILTVIILILLPTLATFSESHSFSGLSIAKSIGLALGKFSLLVLIMFTVGQKAVSYVLFQVARLKSQEMLTLAVLAITFLVATGSAVIFGASIPLGAFIAGMVIGKTTVRHEAAANALPFKDIFAIIFFLAVGMLFNPMAIVTYFPFFIGIMAVILIIKPISAYMIALLTGCSMSVALTVALSLAQIGEFSFILAEEAIKFKLLPEHGYDIIVACALTSIMINPFLFQFQGKFESWLHNWGFLKIPNDKSSKFINELNSEKKTVIIVGFGPTGREVSKIALDHGFHPVVIESNIDTVAKLEDDIPIIFGDAGKADILNEAHVKKTSYLFITILDIAKTLEIIHAARRENPGIEIIARIQFMAEISSLEHLGVRYVCSETEALKVYLATVKHVFS